MPQIKAKNIIVVMYISGAKKIKAKKEAAAIVEQDFRLESPENRPLRRAIQERYGWKAVKKIPVPA